MFVAQVPRHYLRKCSIFKTEKSFFHWIKKEVIFFVLNMRWKKKIQDPLMKMIPKTPRFLSQMPHSWVMEDSLMSLAMNYSIAG